MFKGIFDFKNQRVTIKWKIIYPVFFYFIVSLLILNSTSNNDVFVYSTFYKQILWFGVGAIVFVLVQFVRIQYLYDYSYLFFMLLFLLILSTIFSPEIQGAKSWIILGPFSFQPSEIGKIIYIIFIARFFTDYRIKDKFSKIFIIMLVLLMIPPLLIFQQPDLGTAMIYLSVIIPMLFWAGYNSGILFLLVSPLVSLVAVSNLVLFYIWMVVCVVILIYTRQSIFMSLFNFFLNLICGLLSPYIFYNILALHQRQRILTILDPYSDPLRTGYQVIQSMISIGSGGMWGKGLGNGTQTQLKFLPVRDSDFIISVISEELGFITIFFILFSLLWFIYWCFDLSVKIENKFASVLLVGCCTIIFMHFIINMGMVAGLLPVTGLPVPFISYGGTFLLTCSILLGIINNIANNYI